MNKSNGHDDTLIYEPVLNSVHIRNSIILPKDIIWFDHKFLNSKKLGKIEFYSSN